MRAIIGIGNPGSSYQFNKHNAGFLLIDHFANLNSIKFIPSKYSYYQASSVIDNFDYVLIKPTTYVNNSGLAAMEAIKQYNFSHKDLLVLCDDVYQDIGAFKIKLSGGDGGHNGIGSIIYHLNTTEFPRIKIGVGKNPEEKKLADYVLSDFSKEDEPQIANVLKICSTLIREFIVGGITKMLETNSKLYNEDKENIN